MNLTIFYSWQSDLENKLNRSFIEDALEKAVKDISNADVFELEAVIDRDTYGIPGSPSIVEAITAKIARSDVFVCDISIINPNSSARPTPNPNVLFELGYASAVLGWDRIILVQNTAFGGPEQLPFDLRGRRVLQYTLDATLENRAGQRQLLRQKLTKTFKDAFKYYSDHVLGSKEKVIWWGTWELQTKLKMQDGRLQIHRVLPDAFFFDITISDGARTGDVSGQAYITTPHAAYARIQVDENENCEIVFRRSLERESWYIEIEQSAHCRHFHGMGASFSGTYKYIPESIVYGGYLNQTDLNEIERLLGEHLFSFLSNFQQIQSFLDDADNLRIIQGGVKGMYTHMESIVILDQMGSVWCAFLDLQTNVIRYFTNVVQKQDEKPEFMRNWIDRFTDRKVIVNNILKPE